MALSISINLNNSLIINNAYVRIDTINGYKGELTISVNSYVSQESFIEGDDYLGLTRFYKFIPILEDNSPNFIKQGYEYLKTLPEFENATDC